MPKGGFESPNVVSRWDGALKEDGAFRNGRGVVAEPGWNGPEEQLSRLGRNCKCKEGFDSFGPGEQVLLCFTVWNGEPPQFFVVDIGWWLRRVLDIAPYPLLLDEGGVFVDLEGNRHLGE